MSYGDHWIATSKQRWLVLVGYWFMLSIPLHYFGYYTKLLQGLLMNDDDNIITITPIHFISVVLHIIFISFWRHSVYAFHRPISVFASLIYPIGHVNDTLMWLCMFDIGKFVIGKHIINGMSSMFGIPSIISTFHFGDDDLEFGKHGIVDNDSNDGSNTRSSSNRLLLWFCGYVMVSMYVAIHRKTFELWYLPEHHPPAGSRSKYDNYKTYVPIIIIATGIQTYLYNLDTNDDHNNLIFVVLLKYCIDLYCILAIRLPSPFCKSYNPVKENNAKCIEWKDWTGY